MIALNLGAFAYCVLCEQATADDAAGLSAFTSSGAEILQLHDETEDVMGVSLNNTIYNPAGLCHTLYPYEIHEAANDALVKITGFGKQASISSELIREGAGYRVYLQPASAKESNHYVVALMSNETDDC
jgi:hypothetical protein